MSSQEPPLKLPAYSVEEQRVLHNERFIAEVLNTRRAQQDKARRALQIFLESTGGAALITVLLGGFLGSYLTNSYQLKQAAIERERAARQRLQELRFQATADSLTLVSATVASAEDLLQLSTQPFLQAPLKQRDAIRGAYIDADANWRKQDENVVGFKLNYYFRDHPDVINAWKGVRLAVSNYGDCAGDWIEHHPKYTDGLSNGCKKEREAVGHALDALQRAMPTLNE
jgi:hypothetical protein